MRTSRIAWIVLACAFAIQFAFSGIHFTFGVFLKPIAEELSGSRGATTFAYTLLWWVSSPASIETASASRHMATLRFSWIWWKRDAMTYHKEWQEDLEEVTLS